MFSPAEGKRFAVRELGGLQRKSGGAPQLTDADGTELGDGVVEQT